MRTKHLIIFIVCSLPLFLLPACSKDGDGVIETKEPKKELSELPERKSWSVMDIEEFGE